MKKIANNFCVPSNVRFPSGDDKSNVSIFEPFNNCSTIDAVTRNQGR